MPEGENFEILSDVRTTFRYDIIVSLYNTIQNIWFISMLI